MTYFVVINNKYIINVIASSAGVAEHAILDQYAGTQYAQAFTAQELDTDTFKHFMEVCETISAKELMEKSDEYAERVKAAAAARARCSYLDEEIAHMKEKINMLQKERAEESQKTTAPELI